MGIVKTLGGDRVQSGNQMRQYLHGYGRSTHNLSRRFKSDQAVGTCVPYFLDIGLNGTTYDIGIRTKVRTLPTNGPIFGTFKHQVDVFHAPIRLYIGALHNNALGIGLNMSQIKLPTMSFNVNKIDFTRFPYNSQQVSQDSLVAYLGIRGLGNNTTPDGIERTFPAIFLLMYWDVYKNYYANKQEETGYVITQGPTATFSAWETYDTNGRKVGDGTATDAETLQMSFGMTLVLQSANGEPSDYVGVTAGGHRQKLTDLRWRKVEKVENGITYERLLTPSVDWGSSSVIPIQGGEPTGIKLEEFELANIDNTREAILATPKNAPFYMNTKANLLPYSATYGHTAGGIDNKNNCFYKMGGLGVKTYLSDRFNNWLSTEWIDGENGVNEISAVDVSDGKLTMDALILSKKIYNMLNRIAISGGSYNDWQESVWGEKTVRMAESPMYDGGYSSEIVFDEVVSNSAAVDSQGSDQPLGSLAGRGSDTAGRGGNVKIKIREPSMIMVIGSITPRVDYCDGNKWWNELETMDDFHKPELDQIGFQELITEEMAAWDTQIGTEGALTKFSAGKQTAYIEYQTNVDESYGDFTAGEPLSFMALNRYYEADETTGRISDLTTYIDPTKYNMAFANAKLDAKNFWVQCLITCKVRRKMSAKQIPNL